MSRLLTVRQNQERLDISRSCLESFKRNKKDSLRCLNTVDETWVHHCTPETKEKLKQWTPKDEPTSREVKAIPSAGKVMATVFWNS